ncbi:MAG: iron-containing alcohol dehydrogenase [Victivallales bacterium]|nr:iron-containing alcohol dehydrogenase [Victivallales bacterium]
MIDYQPVFAVDNAFKFGCGRFRQEEHLLERCAEEVVLVGHSPLLVCTDVSADIALPKIRASLSNAGIPFKLLKYNGFCDIEAAKNYIEQGVTDGCDVIIGCGGGVIIDFAKILADISRLPIITIPTSSATCSAYTPLSVCYDADGKSVGSAKYTWTVSAVLVDMTVLSQQPPRLLVAGACDARAKKIEIEQRLPSHNASESDAGFAFCYELAKYIYVELDRKMESAYEDVVAHRVSKALNDVVYFSIVGAGLISGLANGSRQCAVAHKFYLYVRTAFTHEAAQFLHGELVAIGLSAQLAYTGEPEVAERFRERLKRLSLPASLNDLYFPVPQGALDDCAAFVCQSSAMKGSSEDDRLRLRKALQLIIL